MSTLIGRHPSTRGHSSPTADDAPPAGATSRGFRHLHRLAHEFLAYRQGQLDGHRHSLEEAADRFGIDVPFAERVDAYLAARERLEVSRAGWRAGRARW